MLDFDNGATSKIDDVLSEYGGLLRVVGGCGGGVVAHEILVSAQGPLVLVLRLRVWGQGLTI